MVRQRGNLIKATLHDVCDGLIRETVRGCLNLGHRFRENIEMTRVHRPPACAHGGSAILGKAKVFFAGLVDHAQGCGSLGHLGSCE